jgi:hypothetical protein
MSRINGGSPRGVYPENTQTTQPTFNTVPPPVLRSREKTTGRDDDSDVLDSNPDAKIQASEPKLKSRIKANQLPLELESIDCERFVYTKAQFNEALNDKNAKALVRMMRFGTRDTDWSEGETKQVIHQLFHATQPTLIAELVHESKNFQSAFIEYFNGEFFCQHHLQIPKFIKTINDHRELPEHLKKKLLADWLINAVGQEDIEKIKSAVKAESEILSNTGHMGYHFALISVFQDNRNICTYLLENMITEKSKTKPEFNVGVCGLAARAAADVRRNDLVFIFQDEILSRLEANPEPPHESMLGYDIKHRWDEVIPIFETYLCMLDADNSSSSDSDDDDSGDVDSEFINQIREQKVFNLMVDECVRPALAQSIINLSWKCISVFDMNETDKSNRELHDVVIASQLGLLVINDPDDEPTTSIQAALLKDIGEDFIKKKIGSVDSLLVECFEFIESDFTIEAGRIADHLVAKFIFPKSLADFIDQSMREIVDKHAVLPMPALPPGTSYRDGSKLLKQMVKTNAREEFIQNFGDILKRQQLITLFNADSTGREEVWTNYFYAYLDVLKAALPSPKTEH